MELRAVPKPQLGTKGQILPGLVGNPTLVSGITELPLAHHTFRARVKRSRKVFMVLNVSSRDS